MNKELIYKAIPVTERMPNVANENYLTISSKGFETARFFNGTRFETAHYEGEITHWLEKISTHPLPTAEEWISVEDRMPEDIGVYLCRTNDGGVMTCFVAANGWWNKIPDARFYGDMGDSVVFDSKEHEREVTHWLDISNHIKSAELLTNPAPPTPQHS